MRTKPPMTVRLALTLPVVATALLLLLAACEQDGPRAHPLDGGSAPGGTAPVAPTNPHGAQPPMPTGHPDINGPVLPAGPIPVAGGGDSPKPQPPAGTMFAWTAPQTWKQGPASGMRAAQFDVPGETGDGNPAQCVVFRGIGGSTESNIERWVGMVTPAAGKTTKDVAKVATSTKDGVTITRLETRGGYSSNMGTPVAYTDSIFLGAVVEREGVSTVHVRYVGPAAVVEAERANFEAFIGSFHAK